MRSDRRTWGQTCFHCYLSFLLGLFKTEQTLFQSTFRLARTSMEIFVFLSKLLPCNCNYSPLSMYLCILSMCGCLWLPGLKGNLCKVCCWKDSSRVRFVQSSCRTRQLVCLRASVGNAQIKISNSFFFLDRNSINEVAHSDNVAAWHQQSLKSAQLTTKSLYPNSFLKTFYQRSNPNPGAGSWEFAADIMIIMASSL